MVNELVYLQFSIDHRIVLVDKKRENIMFRKISKWIHLFKMKNESIENSVGIKTEKIEHISTSIKHTEEKLKARFKNSNDFVLRKIAIREIHSTEIIIAYIDGLVDKQIINTNILKPLMFEMRMSYYNQEPRRDNIKDELKENILTVGELDEIEDFTETIESILSGDTVMYIEGYSMAFKIGTRAWEGRSIEEPKTEAVVRGPREGFTETLRINTSLLRRKIKDTGLKLEYMKIGRRTKTDICICYIEELVDKDILETVKRRLGAIDTDGILESGYLEQFIEDAPFSLFSTVGNAEKPDKVAGKILEGRIAILCDGTPFVLTIPHLFIEVLQTSEDYYVRSYPGSFKRLLRVLALAITGTLPAFYVALISFHVDVLPHKLLLSIAASREGVPVSPFVEALFMGSTFEILKEAGVRMPRPIGQAVSIVGALVIGEAAVKAGLVSNIMIIVVALTGITSFIVPSVEESLPIIRLFYIMAANTMGFFGMIIITMIMFLHMCSIRSFGVPYMSPIAPFKSLDLKDTLVRLPLWLMRNRPADISWRSKDHNRMDKMYLKKED